MVSVYIVSQMENRNYQLQRLIYHFNNHPTDVFSRYGKPQLGDEGIIM